MENAKSGGIGAKKLTKLAKKLALLIGKKYSKTGFTRPHHGLEDHRS